MGVEPLLQVGLTPGLVKPVAWIRRCLSNLLGYSLVVGASFLE